MNITGPNLGSNLADIEKQLLEFYEQRTEEFRLELITARLVGDDFLVEYYTRALIYCEQWLQQLRAEGKENGG